MVSESTKISLRLEQPRKIDGIEAVFYLDVDTTMVISMDRYIQFGAQESANAVLRIEYLDSRFDLRLGRWKSTICSSQEELDDMKARVDSDTSINDRAARQFKRFINSAEVIAIRTSNYSEETSDIFYKAYILNLRNINYSFVLVNPVGALIQERMSELGIPLIYITDKRYSYNELSLKPVLLDCNYNGLEYITEDGNSLSDSHEILVSDTSRTLFCCTAIDLYKTFQSLYNY